MHLHVSFILVLANLGFGVAKKCTNATVPVHISARTADFDIAVPQTNLEAVAFFQNATLQGRNLSQAVLVGYQTTTGVYNISTQLCMPDNRSSGRENTIQILTHGIGFDRGYWDLAYNDFNYSYVDVATAAGFSTLSYDRLGIARSSHGDPLREIQSSLEIQALRALTELVRNGTFPGVQNPPKRIVHVGHSFGSAQTYTLVDLYPTISDGVILTGFSFNNTYGPLFNSVGSLRLPDPTAQLPERKYPPGYFISSNAGAVQFQFLYSDFFDPGILTFANNTKQAVTIGELLTNGYLPPRNSFQGPVFVINGNEDLRFCAGNCSYTGRPGVTSLTSEVGKAFQGEFSFYNQPKTGHGINLHYNATAAYTIMQDWIVKHNLA